MKRQTVSILGLVLCAAALVVAQTAPSLIGKKGKIAWDAVTTNEDGTPCTDLASYTCVLTAQTVTNPDTGPILSSSTVTPPNVEQMIVNLTPKPAPGKYNAWVRATDLAGNDSTWAGPAPFDFDGTSPGKPNNARAVAK